MDVQSSEQPSVAVVDAAPAADVQSTQQPSLAAVDEAAVTDVKCFSPVAASTSMVLELAAESETESMFSFDDSVADEDFDPGDMDTDESIDSQNCNGSDNDSMVPDSCAG